MHQNAERSTDTSLSLLAGSQTVRRSRGINGKRRQIPRKFREKTLKNNGSIAKSARPTVLRRRVRTNVKMRTTFQLTSWEQQTPNLPRKIIKKRVHVSCHPQTKTIQIYAGLQITSPFHYQQSKPVLQLLLSKN